MSAIFPFTRVEFYGVFYVTIDLKRKLEIEITDNFYTSCFIP